MNGDGMVCTYKLTSPMIIDGSQTPTSEMLHVGVALDFAKRGPSYINAVRFSCLRGWHFQVPAALFQKPVMVAFKGIANVEILARH